MPLESFTSVWYLTFTQYNTIDLRPGSEFQTLANDYRIHPLFGIVGSNESLANGIVRLNIRVFRLTNPSFGSRVPSDRFTLTHRTLWRISKSKEETFYPD